MGKDFSFTHPRKRLKKIYLGTIATGLTCVEELTAAVETEVGLKNKGIVTETSAEQFLCSSSAITLMTT